MNTRQKKALYESIMKSVAKTVKRKLNENNDDTPDDLLDDIFSNIYSMIYDGGDLNSAEEARAAKSLARDLFSYADIIQNASSEVIGNLVKKYVLNGKNEYIRCYGGDDDF